MTRTAKIRLLNGDKFISDLRSSSRVFVSAEHTNNCFKASKKDVLKVSEESTISYNLTKNNGRILMLIN